MSALAKAKGSFFKPKTAWNGFYGGMSCDAKAYFCIALACAAFIAGGVYCLVYEYYLYALLPLALLGVVYMFVRFGNSLLLVSLFTPWALKVSFGDASLSMPSEPVLIAIMLMFCWQILIGKEYDKKIVRHPVTVLLLVNLLWTLVTCFTSQDIVVSFKYLLSQLWFVIPCFFFAVPLFAKKTRMHTFIALYCLSLCIVIVYSTVRFAASGFDFNFSYYAMQPFYNDHTAYGAVIALFIPAILYHIIYGRRIGLPVGAIVLSVLALVVLGVGFVLSYSRAAWMSLFVALGVWVLAKIKINGRVLIGGGVVVLLALALSWSSIMGRFSKNEQDSSGNMVEHIASITNVSTDDSNVERLNRWYCAIQMFRERPLLGRGAGTYAFLYSPYQKSHKMSGISTDEGNLGSTHSEYLRPLSEQGLIGMLLTVALFLSVFIVGIRAYKRTDDKLLANFALFVTMALITYYLHGFLNQFLETDKLAVPFWTFTAMIVAIDLYAPKKNACELEKGENKKAE